MIDGDIGKTKREKIGCTVKNDYFVTYNLTHATKKGKMLNLPIVHEVPLHNLPDIYGKLSMMDDKYCLTDTINNVVGSAPALCKQFKADLKQSKKVQALNKIRDLYEKSGLQHQKLCITKDNYIQLSDDIKAIATQPLSKDDREDTVIFGKYQPQLIKTSVQGKNALVGCFLYPSKTIGVSKRIGVQCYPQYLMKSIIDGFALAEETGEYCSKTQFASALPMENALWYFSKNFIDPDVQFKHLAQIKSLPYVAKYCVEKSDFETMQKVQQIYANELDKYAKELEQKRIASPNNITKEEWVTINDFPIMIMNNIAKYEKPLLPFPQFEEESE